MEEVKFPFDSLFIQELRRHAVPGVYIPHCGVSEELENQISLLRVNPRYSLREADMRMCSWFNED